MRYMWKTRTLLITSDTEVSWTSVPGASILKLLYLLGWIPEKLSIQDAQALLIKAYAGENALNNIRFVNLDFYS